MVSFKIINALYTYFTILNSSQGIAHNYGHTEGFADSVKWVWEAGNSVGRVTVLCRIKLAKKGNGCDGMYLNISRIHQLWCLLISNFIFEA